MTGMLASIASADEAAAVVAAGVDIIDLKDPAAGALGALPAAIVGDCVGRIAGRVAVSATVGDLPMEPSVIARAVAEMARLGVDIVKVGWFPGGDQAGCLQALAAAAKRGVRLVAVMFADRQPDFELVGRLADCRVAGSMLDTADKQGGSLRRHLPDHRLRDFVRHCSNAGLMSGLAGSLLIEDIAPLVRLRPDYLGFRGALCAGDRKTALDPVQLMAVRDTVKAAERDHQPAAKVATAAAGAQRAAHSRTAGGPSTISAKST